MTTTTPRPPRPRRPLLRQPGLWLGVAALVVLALVIGVLVSHPSSTPGAGATSSPASASPSTAAVGARPADEVLGDLIARTDATVKAAGGTWPGWTTATAGYTAEPCGIDDSGPQQYKVTLTTKGSADPAGSAATVTALWKKQGWIVRTVVPVQAANADYTEVAADFTTDADGGGLVFTVSHDITGIEAQSECSTDPAMNQTTK